METRYVDLIKTASMMRQFSIPESSYLLHLDDEVDPKEIGKEVGVDTKVFKATLFMVKFNKLKLRDNVNNTSFRSTIDRVDTYHYVYGSIYVLIHKDDISNIKSSWLLEARGRLSRLRGKRCTFFLTCWKNKGTSSKPVWDIGYAAVGVQTSFNDFKDVIADIESNHRLSPPKAIPSKLQETGVEVQNPMLMVAPTTVYEPEPLGELGVSKVGDKMRDIIPPSSEMPKSIASYMVPDTRKASTSSSTSHEINRGKLLPKEEYLTEKINDLESGYQKVYRYVSEKLNADAESTTSDDNITDIDEYTDKQIETIGNRILNSWNKSPEVGQGYKGRDLLKESLLRIVNSDRDTRLISDLISLYDSTPDKIINTWISNTTNGNDQLEILLRYRTELLYSIYEVLLNLSCKLSIVDIQCKKSVGYSLFQLMKVSPYRIGVIANISVKDMDKLAMVSHLFGNSEQEIDRGIAYYHEYLTDENKMDGSTLMLTQQARLRLKAGYHISKTEYSRLMQSNGTVGTYLDYSTVVNLRYYFNLSDSDMVLPIKGWKIDVTECYLPTVNVIDKYIKEGIGVQLSLPDSYIMDFSLYNKELSIYDMLYQFDYPIPKKFAIDTYLRRFELTQGENFKLEDRQREAIRNCFRSENAVSVITGGAGCGKTTIIKAIVYMYINALEYDVDDMIFVAPTGKAANRIYESTGYKAKTIHSQFKIGVVSDSRYDIESKAKVIFIDESSMINIDVMYEMLKRLPKNMRVIFCGDTNQLVPIGFGQCFADMQHYTPVTTLNVAKRAEGTSLITRNAKKIVKGYEILSSGDDFKIQNTDDFEDGICSVINKLTSSGVDFDDIQVISPVSTDKYRWGTSHLNSYLQSKFNPINDINKIVNHKLSKTKFMTYKVGDRVIQTKNNTEMPRYILKSNNHLERSVETGVLNGDIGKISHILNSSQMEMMTDDDTLLSLCEKQNHIFVIVEYTVGDTYWVVYQTKTSNSDGNPTYNGFETVGGDILQLSLAYAITVHKMQGSQSKHIILLWYTMRRGDFLSRNMLYTAITRASKGVTIFGDLSAIDRARHIISNDKRFTFLKLYFTQMIKG